MVCGPGENAGVVDIGDGLVAVFKMESHNHPSFIEPYQGAATGVGGILRDVFTMGARPIALLDALRFGDPSHPKTRHLVDGVVAGIGGYGNCVGVPTVGGECTFHRAYNGNILVNAMCVGIARADRIFYAKASGVGNPVVYVGAKTGRDGIHGATMASAEFSDETEAKRPTVQVGDPFTEKLLIEACLELMETDCIVAIQDMGAAGLTSSSFEMAARGEAGIQLDLDRVPLRETGMTPYEIMLSESQERMLMVLEDGREAEALAVFAKWGLDFAVIGRVTDSGRMVLRWQGEVVADMPVAPVSGASPVYERPYAPTPRRVPLAANDREAVLPHRDALLRLLGAPDLASKAWIWQQYDHMVMGDTVQRPGGDAAVVRVHGTRSRPGADHRLHPALLLRRPASGRHAGGGRGLAQPGRGRRPAAGDHRLPQFRQPRAAAGHGPARRLHRGHGRGLHGARLPGRVRQRLALQRDRRQRDPADAQCRRPGRDRRSGRHGRDRPGAEPASRWCCSASAWAGSAARSTGSSWSAARTARRRRSIWPPSGAPASSCWARSRPGRVAACHDLADGGLAVAVAEMCLAGGSGATLDGAARRRQRAGWWFGEDQGRYLLAVREDQRAATCWRPQPPPASRPRGRPDRRRCVDPRRRAPHIDAGAARDARRLAAGLHGGRRRGLKGA